MIKAAILTPNFSTGGAERWVATLLKYADPRIIQWTGLCISGWGSIEPGLCQEALAAGITIYSEPKITQTLKRGLPTPAALSVDCDEYLTRCETLAAAVREASRGADILLAWGSPRYVSFLNQEHVPRKFVYCSHSSHHRAAKITQPHYAKVYLTAVSEQARKPITKDGNPPVTVIYNGVDEERLHPTASRESVRQEWGFDDRRVIAYIGRFSPEKNPHAALRALQGLSSDWAAVHYGDHIAHGSLLPQAKQLASEQNLPARFYDPIPDVGNVLAGSDVVMLASGSEAFSLVMIEAWLAKKPVIATPVGAVPELRARYGDLVIEVPQNPTTEVLAAACQRALGPEGTEIVRRAYAVASEQFTATAMLSRWYAYFQGIMEA